VAKARGRPRGIPDDLLRDASRRLGILSLLGAGLWLAGTVLYHVALAARTPAWLSWQSSDAIALVSVIVSFALYLYTRGEGRDPHFILDLGLAHLVWTGVALGLAVFVDNLAQKAANARRSLEERQIRLIRGVFRVK
jgi:hypothetical protein